MKNLFTQQAGIEFPIIGGAMYPCSSPELVAAVSEAGGIGIVQPISFTYVRHYDLRESLRYVRQMTKKPYGMNIILVPGYEERLRNWMNIALEEGCRFFITSLGKPTWVVESVHQVGGYVYHDVVGREHALKAMDVGVDGLICVNNRAGGHLGSSSPEALFQELQDLKKPLICAGGVGDEQTFVKVMSLGYEGVQMATRFIATYECDETDEYKQAIVNATESDIVATENVDSILTSVIYNDYAKQQGLAISPLAAFCLRHRTLKKWYRRFKTLREAKLSSKKSSQRWLSAGKSAAQVHEIEHVEEIIKRFANALLSSLRTE